MVAALDRQQRVVHIGDQVQQKLQGREPLARHRVGVLQLLLELLDLVDDAIVARSAARGISRGKRRAPITGGREFGAVRPQPHRMPVGARDAGLLALVAQHIGPGRLAGDVVFGEAFALVGRQDREDLGAHGGIALLQGNEGDDAVALQPPGETRPHR